MVEGTAAAFVVELNTESRKTVTVSYATADGTALASEDYTAVVGDDAGVHLGTEGEDDEDDR